MRLRCRRHFREVFATRCRVADQNLVMYLSYNGLGVTRLGLGVGKMMGRAVARNRAKRLIREAFRQLQMGTAEPGFDLVCMPRSGQRHTLSDYKTSLGNLLARGVKELQKRGLKD